MTMTTSAEQHGIPQDSWERLIEATRCTLQHGVSLSALFSLIMNDPQIQGLNGLPPSPLQAAGRRWSLALKHTCKNYWTCPKFCDLCRKNPNKRCEADGDLAPKHLENAKLETYCGTPILATLRCFEVLQGEQPNGVARFDKLEAQQFYVECSLVSASGLEGWLEDQGPGAVMTVDTLRQFEALSTTSTKEPAQQLLRKGASNQETSDNLRVRADFLEGTDHASIDVRVLENSDRRLDANNKYQLLVVLIQKGDDQPVDYALSNKFQVTTSRALSGWNTQTPCWNTCVGRLDGCGPQTRTNLQDVRKCAWEKGRGYEPPAEGINQVSTAEELLQLHLEMKSWVGVPRTVRNSLTPEATVRHAEKMLPKDSRLRIFWPKDSQHGAMYLCQQGHVDLADSTTAVLLTYFPFHDGMRITLPEGRNAEQNQTMAVVTGQAEMAWRDPGQVRHPGWYAAREEIDGQPPLDYFRAMEINVSGSLDFYSVQLAQTLGLPPAIFQHSAMLCGEAHQFARLALPPPGQQPLQRPNQGPVGQFPAITAAPSPVPGLGQENLLGLPRLPSSSNNLNAQQHNGPDVGYSAQAPMPSTFHDSHVAASHVLPSFSNLNNEGVFNHTGSTSPGEMPCLPYAVLTTPGIAQPMPVSLQPGPESWTKHGVEQHISHPAGMLQPQQPPSSSMRQDVQAPEQGSLADPMCLGSVGSVASEGCPTPPRVVDGKRWQSHTERGRSRQLLPTNSSTDLEPVRKRRNTAPADMEQALEQAFQDICSQNPSGSLGNQANPPGPGALVPIPSGGSLAASHQAWTAHASSSSSPVIGCHSIVPALLPQPRIERSLSQRSWQFPGVDPSRDGLSFLNPQFDVMNWIQSAERLAEEGGSQQLEDQVEEIVDMRRQHVPPVVELVLARFWRALVMRRRRPWQRAVRAALQNGGRASTIEDRHAVNFASRGSPVDFWGDAVATHEGDHLPDIDINISTEDLDLMTELLS